MIESLGDYVTIILSIGAVIGISIRYIGDYYKYSKEMDLFGADKDIPEPLRTILRMSQFNQVHQFASLEERINEVTALLATMRANCLVCPHNTEEKLPLDSGRL